MLAMLKLALGGATPEVEAVNASVPVAQENWRIDARHSAYWPQHELDSFILQMACHGRAVHTAMMLGDIDYARQQLADAVAIECPKLRALSERLSAYFDHPPCACSLSTH